jgi:amino-acid N-acetyltransferase
MHNLAASRPAVRHPRVRRSRPALSTSLVVRAATAADVGVIAALVDRFADERLLLPRTAAAIALDIDDFVVAADANGRVLACAALHEYSPSLAEVTSVAVTPDQHGRGLGSTVVLAVENMALRRGIPEVFALSLADRFFTSLGYSRCALDRYPEKLARYRALERAGLPIVPRGCFFKRLGA